MSPLEVASAFVAAVNAGDTKALGNLLTPDHTFVDGDGSERTGRYKMKLGWQEYFDPVPDFRIEVTDEFESEGTVVVLGRASGTFVQDGELKPENRWSVPAAWRAVVESQQVAVWQLYANQHSMAVIYDRIQGGARRIRE